jgi:CHAT domain-containing protein
LTQGFFDVALQEADKGYRKTERHDLLWNWKFRVLRAEVHLRRGDLQQAVELLAPEPPGNSPPDVSARRKIIQGEAFCGMNRQQETETALREAEQLIRSARRDLQAELALTRGRCALSGDRTLAQRYLASAAELAHGRDGFIEGTALLDIGWVLLRGHHCETAIDPLSRALAVTDSPWVQERTLGNLAECYAELGDWKRSMYLAEQAGKLAEQIKNIGDREVWLIDVGRAHFGLREYSQAEPYYVRALAIARNLNDSDGVWRCLKNLTQLALKRHDLNAAEVYLKEESTLTIGAERRAYVSFDTAEIAVERKEFAKAEQLFREILGVKTSDPLRLTTQRELGNVYWQENKITEADRTFRETIEQAEAILRHLPPQYRMAFLDVDAFYDSYVRFLVARDRSFDALRTAERGRGQILSEALRDTRGVQPFLDLKAVQAALQRRNQIALAYSLTDDESFIWVITPSQFEVKRLPSHKSLRPLVDAYKNEVIEHPRPIEDSSGGEELYKTLIQPAESLIPKHSRVVIIPSKILCLVNFEALIVPEVRDSKRHYWLDDVEVETASSLAFLAHSKTGSVKAAKSKKELLLLGAPLEADKAFPTLKYAPEEMNRVRSHFPVGQETVVSGKYAIPQAYRASNPSEYRFIHIDAHSAASELNPMDSFIVFSPFGDSYKLFAHDITGTPLHADLVTLSACYGAGTRWYQGEGIVGLGWAFLRAGAHQVVASLWAVDDASTPQLMDDFYGELSKGKSAAEALRAAKLKMLHTPGPNSQPHYWAPLQLYTGS